MITVGSFLFFSFFFEKERINLSHFSTSIYSPYSVASGFTHHSTTPNNRDQSHLSQSCTASPLTPATLPNSAPACANARNRSAMLISAPLPISRCAVRPLPRKSCQGRRLATVFIIALISPLPPRAAFNPPRLHCPRTLINASHAWLGGQLSPPHRLGPLHLSRARSSSLAHQLFYPSKGHLTPSPFSLPPSLISPPL